MSRLPGTNSWPPADIAARKAFLETCAREANYLSALLAPAPIERSRTEGPGAAESYSEAAALAMSTDDTAAGLHRLISAAQFTEGSRVEMRTLTQRALFSAIARTGRVRITSTHLLLDTPRISFSQKWSELSTPQIARALPILIAAALATGPLASSAEILFDISQAGKEVTAALDAALPSREFAAVELFEVSRPLGSRIFVREKPPPVSFRNAQIAVLEMEQNYQDRIELLQRDRFHWKQLRGRAELIDWRLLAIHLGLLRQGRDDQVHPLPTRPAATFLRKLAIEIHGLTPLQSPDDG